MILILHGENLTRSRSAVVGLQKKLNIGTKVEVSIKDVTPPKLLDMCAAFDIFGNPSLVVLDVTMAGRMKVDGYIEAMMQIPPRAVLVILSAKELKKSNAFVKNASKLSAKVVSSPVKPASNIFRFVDSVYSGNRDASYKELQRLLLDNEDPFKLFSMLLYGLRNIAFAKFDSSEFAKMAPFVKKKSKGQALRFSKVDILALFESFYMLDKDAKTGVIVSDLLVPLAVEKILHVIL
jgi:DNA polymerase III delta subunit